MFWPAVATLLLAAFLGFFSWSHSSQKDHPGVLDGVTLAEAVEAARPAKFPASQLPCHALLRWTPQSLATSAPLLHDVWTKARDAELTRFTYYVAGRTLGPFLRTQWSPTPHRIVADKSTKELFEACASREEEVYFYSGLAEGPGGKIHEDVQNLVSSFSDAVRAVAAKSLEAKANVWISCPLTGASAHYDMGHNVVIQIFGVKAFDLLPPSSLRMLPIPPTGHPYARQAMNDTGSTFSTITLQPGDALYLPPLWAHRTSSGAEGPSISLNVFVGSAAEDVSEQLSQLPLPFEADWPNSTMHAAVAVYLTAFLEEAGVAFEFLEKRWSLVELREEPDETSCGSVPEGDRVRLRGKDAASRVKVLPKDHQLPVVLDYADDVMIGILDAPCIPGFLRKCMTPATDHGLPWKTSFAGICMSSGTSTVSVTAAGFQDSFSRGHSAGGTTWADLGGLAAEFGDRAAECPSFGKLRAETMSLWC
eukprot:s2467_g8.t1